MSRGWIVTAGLLRLLAACAIAACGDDHHPDHGTSGGAHTSPYPSCNEITQACYAVDIEEGPIHDCHGSAHAATSDEPCMQIKPNCLAICKAAAADAGVGVGDGGSDGGH